MRTKALFLITISAFAAALSACGSGANTNNSMSHANMDHSVASPQAQDKNLARGEQMDHSTMDHSAMKSSPDAAKAEYDVQFLDTMIVHHQGAVDMAKLIPGKALNGELKKLGIQIISSQEKEIAAMREWRAKWFGGKPEALNMEMPGMNASMAGMDMKKLGGLSGKAFDVEFVKQMIPHHEGAVVMAKEAQKKSQKDEIKTLAAGIIRDQEAEILQMKGWLEEWK
ncbi:MAG: DUF305 domain-containing protein [Pyrinomonadaceae bacterium]